MKCASCGSRVEPGLNFCPECGTAVAGAMGTVAPSAVIPQAVVPTAPGQRTYRHTGGVPPDRSGRPPTRSIADTPVEGTAVTVPLPEPTIRYVPPPVGTPPAGAPPAHVAAGRSRSPGLWAALGVACALAVVVAVVAVLLVTRSDSSERPTAVPADTGGTGVTAASTGDGPIIEDTARSEPDPVEAAALAGYWPAPTNWAIETCGRRDTEAVTGLHTDESKVAICRDPGDGTYHYIGYRNSDGAWSEWLPAHSSPNGDAFNAVLPGSTDASDTTYTVRPRELEIRIGESSPEIQYAIAPGTD